MNTHRFTRFCGLVLLPHTCTSSFLSHACEIPHARDEAAAEADGNLVHTMEDFMLEKYGFFFFNQPKPGVRDEPPNTFITKENTSNIPMIMHFTAAVGAAADPSVLTAEMSVPQWANG